LAEPLDARRIEADGGKGEMPAEKRAAAVP
jgi:hypothetical protein